MEKVYAGVGGWVGISSKQLVIAKKEAQQRIIIIIYRVETPIS